MTKTPDTADTPSARLDASGLQCPLPVLKARKALMRLAPGATLELLASDPMAAIDVPHFCAEAGHELVARESVGDACRFLIRKGRAGPPAGAGEAE